MTYARKRLWLGITGVGMTVLLSLAAVSLDLPHRLIPQFADQTFDSAVAFIALAWIWHAALLLPVDVIGGLVVVTEHRRVMPWIAGWMRGIAVQWLWFTLAVALLLRTAQQFGTTNALIVFLLLQLVLLSRQGLMAWLTGGVAIRHTSDALSRAATEAGIPASMVREIDSDEPSFVGAWCGMDAKRLWVPQRWVEQLAHEQLVVALARRAAVKSRGLRSRGVLVAVAWNTVGFGLAAAAPHADLVTAAGFVSTIAWFTLWTFVGVLVLPTLSRGAVFTADQIVRTSHGASLVAVTITRLDAWQDDEAERAPAVESIFHPVPSRGARLRALAAENVTVSDTSGAWHATRMMLYLSWAGVSGLSRAVHCNVGRPAVWVMLPGD